jgi:hypothetical protein
MSICWRLPGNGFVCQAVLSCSYSIHAVISQYTKRNVIKTRGAAAKHYLPNCWEFDATPFPIVPAEFCCWCCCFFWWLVGSVYFFK